MITRTASRWQTEDWQSAVKSMICSLHQLCDALDLNLSDLDACYQAEQDFPVKVPLSYLKRIKKSDALDPLLLQVLPQAAEVGDTLFVADPLEEQQFSPVPGLIHKYHGRVLLISHPSCAIHCRYCFRRHFPYQDNIPGLKNWSKAFDYIRENRSIHEVIFSGGDPLLSSDAFLQQLMDPLVDIGHVTTLRFHTRLPVVIPERVTDQLLQIITATQLKLVMVLHINHVNEISDEVVEVIKLLQSHGIRLLNQSVLLKGVNNTDTAQRSLLEKLHQLDIQAYYLHTLDRVKGAEHFLVSDAEAVKLYQQLMQQLPGYMLPKLVRELPNEDSKKLLSLEFE